MATITTRAGKGSPLTNNELDANFNNLNAEVTPSRPTVRPSLLLDFAQTKQLDPRITFSRASTATYYDGKSVVKAEENLLFRSQEFDTLWGVNSATVTANATTAPDGTSTADKISEDSTATIYHFLSQSIAKPASALPYTFTLYAKAAERQFVHITIYDNVSVFNRFTFDLVNGTTGTASSVGGGGFSGLTTFITSVGNGWYRIGCSFTSSAASQLATHIHMTPSDSVGLYTGTAGSGIYVWGAQLEQRAYATAYTPTTSSAITNYIPAMQTAASGTARFDHDPVTGESKGLLIEEQRTNLLVASQDFEHDNFGTWRKQSGAGTSVGVSAKATIAPDGTLTAQKLFVASGTSGYFNVYQGVSWSASTTYTLSVHAKSSDHNQLALSIVTSAGNAMVFNTDTGQTISQYNLDAGFVFVRSGYTDLGNGWKRLFVTFTTPAGVPSGQVKIEVGNATNITGKGIYIWGAQLEAGAFATSYIPTPLTYTGRASTATYKAADGLIRIAGNDVARYEPNAAGGSNLLLESAASNYFLMTDYSFGLGGGTGYGFNTRFCGQVTSPSGSLDGIALSSNGSGGNIFISNPYQITLAANTTYTVSCWAKLIDGTVPTAGAIISAEYHNGSSIVRATVPYNGSGLNSTWQRYSVTFTNVTATSNIGTFFLADANSTATIALWGRQIEAGSVATSYIPSVETHTGRSSTATYYDSTGTIRTAASGQPRYTYNPSLLTAPPKLLLEAQATNLATYSEQFDNGAWTKYGSVTVTANNSVAPDGNTTGDNIAFNNTSSGIYQPITAAANTTYTWSVWLKSSSGATVNIVLNTNLGDPINTPVTLTSSWQRFSITKTTSTGTTSLSLQVSSYGSTATFDMWGGQAEVGYAPTSYIPTSGSAVTRAADTSTSAAGSRAADVYSSSQVTRSADSASMTGTNFSSWYRADEGTFYGEAVPTNISSAQSSVFFASTVDPSSSSLENGFAGGLNVGGGGSQSVTSLWARQGSANQAFLATANNVAALGTAYKIAGAYKVNDFAGSVNGATVQTDTVGNLPSGVDKLFIGRATPSAAFSTCIKRIAYYPKRLSNQELQGLTS